MARDMQAATSTAAGAQVVYPGWIVRLDITGDPVLVWTGLGSLSFYAPFTRTNFLYQTTALDNAAWTAALLTSRAASGTVAGYQAHKIIPNATSGQHRNYQIVPLADIPDNSVVIFSIYLKAAGYNFARLLVRDKTNAAYGGFVNLTTGAVSGFNVGASAVLATPLVESLGGGEYRVSFAVNIKSGATDPYVDIRVHDTATTGNWSGNGVDGILMAAPMLEVVSPITVGYAPTSYIASGAARGTVSEPGQTGDDQLNGQTFEGIGNIGEISAVVDAKAGSQAVRMKLPGADLSDDVLKQIVADQRKWQFKPSWLWVALFDEAGVIQGQPVRVKTGRLDNLEVKLDGEVGEISAVIESHQAYASTILATRYSEQREIDATDTSQDYIHDLANKSPHIGGQDGQSGGGLISRLGSRVVQRV